ncbi:MAG: ribosome biogenesis GTP-binding protein YihA/YsxC [Desulfobacterales bacterium]|jgi:GTP-binding protein
MIVKTANFVTSAVRPSQYPPADCPEIAFAGRSNVGKSSLINRLVQRKRLAKTSSTPGRTQLINFFDINGAFHLVDLPGYGYAKVPVSIKKQWGPMVEAYITGRQSLKGVFLLIDVRRQPESEEHQMFKFLSAARVPAHLVVTKADKVTRNRRGRLVAEIQRALPVSPEAIVVASARTGEGMDRIWEMIERLIQPSV